MPTFFQKVTNENDGRYLPNNGNWNENGNTPDIAGGARFINRFTSVSVPLSAMVTSATWTLSAYQNEGVGTTASIWLADNAGTPHTQFLKGVTESAQTGPLSGETRPYDVTALVQQVLSRPGWSSGNSLVLGVRWDGTGSAPRFRNNSSSEAGTLSIEYVTTQYLDVAAPVVAHATVPPVSSVSRGLTPATVVARAVVLVPSVVAPVSITPATVLARAVVPVPVSLSGSGTAPALTVAGPVTARAVVPAPTLSRTVPPPPPPVPWERLIEDPAYHAALTDRAPATSSRAEIISPDGVVLARLGGPDPTHPGALSGTVSCDGAAAIRWTCDLVLDNPALLPGSPTDLLHPLSHNRVRLWWRVRLGDGTWGEIPVGTYYPDLTPTSDDGATLGVRIQGSDAVAEIKRARWDTALDLSGRSISSAIVSILTDRAPWATIAVTPTSQVVPSTYEPGEPGADPWEDVASLAYAAGMVAYVDRMGTVRVEPRPEVSPARAVFSEGAGATLLSLSSVEVDLDWVVNKVTVASASPDVDPPVTGVATDDDPSSPLWLGHGHLYPLRVENEIVTTEQDAATLARNILADRAPVQTVSAEVLPHPHLDPGDTITVGRARAGVAGDFTLASWTLGLIPGDQMAVVATSRKEMF